MDKKFCDCCGKEIKNGKEMVWLNFHDGHIRKTTCMDIPQSRDICLDCYRKIGEMVHIELPKENLVDAMVSSMACLADSIKKALTGGRDESIGGGEHDQVGDIAGLEQSDQSED